MKFYFEEMSIGVGTGLGSLSSEAFSFVLGYCGNERDLGYHYSPNRRRVIVVFVDVDMIPRWKDDMISLKQWKNIF